MHDFSSVKTVLGNLDQVWTTLDQMYSSKGKKNKTEVRARNGHIELACEISEPTSKEGRGDLDFCAEDK